MPTSPPRYEAGRYLCERLGDKRFQELCNALLTAEFAGAQVRSFPVGQSDGGRDAVRRHGERTIVYQAKWTKKPIQSPVGWLEGAIKGEADNIKRLVAQGADEYILITSLAGTAAPGRGSMDRLEAVLAQHSKDFGIPMSCWWRSDVDARVDNASRELKWAYSDMLAGNDLIRYLIEAERTETAMGTLRDLVLKVVAAQENEDARVKFKRVELDVYQLADLFIDVEAQRIQIPVDASPWARGTAVAPDSELGGAAHYLLNATHPWTLVTGEPGQGKSTLGQYICQVHRHALLGSDDARLQPAAPANVRVPFRIDLRDYASWLAGLDPFTGGGGSKPKQQLRAQGAIEQFLVPFIESRSGGLPCDVSTIHEILQRFPTIVVLDGLDEVALASVRERVVAEIDAFASRMKPAGFAPQLVVTTRPNSSNLPLPSTDKFEAITLSRLSESLRTAYLRKWANVNGIRGAARRSLERTFRKRSAEPHIAALADNPMQLSILLYLIHKRGDSVPTGRTALYTSYMETLLDREGEKTRAVVDHRTDLEEVTSYLGWHLQALAEAEGGTGRLPIKALKKAILGYLYDVDKETGLVDDLFTTVTDRVWALTSKIQGTFEFDVQSLREYFAARFLHDFAGADRPQFDAAEVLRQLVRRAYWLNTTRFYLGFATPNELAGFVAGLQEEFESIEHAKQIRTTTWALLADGVFAGRTRAQKEAVRLLTDDLSLVLLLDRATKLDLPRPAPAHGGSHVIQALRQGVEANPDDPLTGSRMQLLSKLGTDPAEHGAWWHDRAVAAIGSTREGAWMRAGGPSAAGQRLTASELDRLSTSPVNLRAILSSGAIPRAGSSLEQTSVRAVLNGLCSDCDPNTAGGYPGDLLRVVAPAVLLAKASGGRAFAIRTGHDHPPIADSRRSAALARLKKRDARFGKVQSALRFNRGEKGSTFPWGNAAQELTSIFGPCWLAAEIAVIGAAATQTGLRTGASTRRFGAEPLGESVHYGQLVQDLRAHRSDDSWWTSAFGQYDDALSHATWALAILSVADESVLRSHAVSLEHVVAEISDEARLALLESSSRIGASGVARRISAVAPVSGESITVTALFAHHSIGLDIRDTMPHLTTDVLASMSELGASSWPALQALTNRAESDSAGALFALQRFGHSMPVSTPANMRFSAYVTETILRAPSAFPADLVLAAENASGQALDQPALAAIADSSGWFQGDVNQQSDPVPT